MIRARWGVFVSGSRLRGRRYGEMRMRIIDVLRTMALWIERILEVHLRMDLVSGLRSADSARKSYRA
jgi:hypothetical protein